MYGWWTRLFGANRNLIDQRHLVSVILVRLLYCANSSDAVPFSDEGMASYQWMRSQPGTG